jgi:predicted DNA-binding protein with PD1-like motif
MKPTLFLLMAGAIVLAAPQQPQPKPLPDEYLPTGYTPNGSATGMKVEEFGPAARTFKLSFRKGDELMTGLVEFVRKNHLKDCYFTGYGALDSALLGWYDPPKRAYKKIVIDGESEIVSLTGNITFDANGKPNIHAHMSVAAPDGVVRGGHLIEAHISVVAQIYLVDSGPGGN